ncbi:hypothetical protein F2P81_019448 [Scophthalmus maximus]|uniref:Uncharacterized protein n=1 Tax=Scophthalmus maximus TaxID=52904 RepID=A0A6A4SB97_SCOMX|nr:hypothetical protein F2P81_019448 [Scophthalmus maximus]
MDMDGKCLSFYFLSPCSQSKSCPTISDLIRQNEEGFPFCRCSGWMDMESGPKKRHTRGFINGDERNTEREIAMSYSSYWTGDQPGHDVKASPRK